MCTHTFYCNKRPRGLTISNNDVVETTCGQIQFNFDVLSPKPISIGFGHFFTLKTAGVY